MTYQVEIAADAEAAILEQGRYIAQDKPRAAERWLVELRAAVPQPRISSAPLSRG